MTEQMIAQEQAQALDDTPCLDRILRTIDPTDFDYLADMVMNKHVLQARDRGGDWVSFRIIEVEFYLYSLEHMDPYVHRADDQLTVAKWYFHKRGGTFCGGTFKGVDITFGDGVYGGILIRSMVSEFETPILGPCMCVNELLTITRHTSVGALSATIGDAGVVDSDVLRLAPATPGGHPAFLAAEHRHLPLYTSARVGLNVDVCRRVGATIDWHGAPYRYITEPWRIKKDRAGMVRGMTEHHNLTEQEVLDLLRKRR